MKKIADFFLNTYLFIASASACLVLTTYILTEQPLKLTALTYFVFFSTLFIYNFHKVSNLFGETPFSISAFPHRVKKISSMTKIMISISLAGICSSAFFIHIKALLTFLPIALITLGYSIPLFKLSGKKKRLREVLLIKISTIAFVWAYTTVTIPLFDSNMDAFTKSSLALFVERFLFMFAICIPFEIRDMEQEKKWGVTTLPQRIGVKGSKLIGVLTLIAFIFLVYLQFEMSPSISRHAFVIPLCLSAFVALLLILFSHQRMNKYYCRIFVDGTMQLQFILLLLFKDLL